MQWTAFLTYILITSHTPGPNVVMAMNSARLNGLRSTLPLIVGMMSGMMIIMTCCAFFNLLLARMLPSFMPLLKAVGTAYILWLAWKIAFPKPLAPEGQQTGGGYSPAFRQGFILQFLNPKVILFGLTTMSTFIVPWTSSKLWLFGCGFFIAMMCSNGVFVWSLLGAVQKRLVTTQRRFYDLLMGGLLAWCAFSVSGLAELIF